jgi:hypothetical protein
MDEREKLESDVMDLLSAAWDERLDRSLRDKLEELLLRDDFEGIQVLVKFTRIHLDLELLASSMSAQRKALDAIARVERKPVSARRWHLQARPLVGLAAAAVLMVGAAVLLTGLIDRGDIFNWGGDVAAAPMARPQQPLGRLLGAPGAEWGESGALADGQLLSEGQVVDLVAGTARVSMDVGAEIVFEAPCRAVLSSAKLISLDRGAVAVKAAKWATGFQVRTQDMLVTDIGTRFVVRAKQRTGSELHVLEGLVVANSLQFPEPKLNVRTAQAVHVDANGGLQAIAYTSPAFADALKAASPLRTISLANTGVGVKVGDQDRNWVIKSGDPLLGPFPKAATVCAAAPAYGANDPDRSQWISLKDGTTPGVPVRTKYSFETSFDLSGFDINSVRLVALVLADNGVEEVRLNGKPLPIAPWSDWYAGVTFFNFHTIEITSGFVPGKNVISFLVANGTDIPAASENVGDTAEELPNPMALRVEWHGSGRPR